MLAAGVGLDFASILIAVGISSIAARSFDICVLSRQMGLAASRMIMDAWPSPIRTGRLSGLSLPRVMSTP